ncbi:type IV pilin-like G/H family protein [Spirulina sp. CS-785/01]|uniref:type IV pilin-like G/H family protein n=1 Tax=Spirulina sp. CS-785/01 TaxID=3021716 RepID=UPI00232E1AE9|nr:type IV pilin-like G/H family protein [Spirulina sp. CS-785/01]MDB9314265.1 type IV pilin-like G/H family protein [Spirulina sp. CS-785/01]
MKSLLINFPIRLTFLLLTPVVLTGCQLNLKMPTPNGEDQAKFYLQAVTRGQEAYYKTNGEFAASMENLNLDFNLDTPEYNYTLLSHGEPPHSFEMKAFAQEEGLSSYTGIIYIETTQEEVNAVANLCKTEQPSPTPPSLPLKPRAKEALKCPKGSVPVQ